MATSRDALAALAATDVREAIPMTTLGPVLTSPPFIPTRSLINIRDLGAVPGSRLPTAHIFRCGTLENAARDPDAIAWLSGHVKRIFDLRKATEREKHPSPEIPGVENVWFEQSQQYPSPKLEDFIEGGGEGPWRKQYMGVVNSYQPTIRAVLEHVRDRPTEPFLFHCTGQYNSKIYNLINGTLIINVQITAGRDRTGVVAGLLQSLAGTAPDDVILDFMLSRLGTEPAREKLLEFAMASVGTEDMEAPGFYNVASLRPSSWNAFLEGLHEQYGGWEGYVMEGLGFSVEDLEKIKKNLQ